MPTVQFRGREIECEKGTVLRDVLLAAGLSPHNGRAQQLNCRGHATCGTCAVEADGDVSEMRSQERRRLSLPPHSLDSGLRLSCQTRVEGDVGVTKYEGFWGQRVDGAQGGSDERDVSNERDDATADRV
ncbi:2Fe-2S iron-sulfur cluster-binding protein [Haloprofundus salilacus]|uniref:2Fe-2S iron-sulfur cluster-binding protein n=1 Tax=Haloprofundus salilacus TaxID=2876190 RepID=UPI001CCA68FE|nr:2Fe-2S iron-sulfur cluster-binding protein [Haloprofundus salilacus]